MDICTRSPSSYYILNKRSTKKYTSYGILFLDFPVCDSGNFKHTFTLSSTLIQFYSIQFLSLILNALPLEGMNI